MQETRHIDENGDEQKMKEFFRAEQGESQKHLISRMNNRLFELEEKGHVLVSQRTFTDRKALERARKATKKLNRMKARKQATPG